MIEIRIELKGEKNREYSRDLEDWKSEMYRVLNPDKEFLEERLDGLFSEIQLPVDFSLAYEAQESGRRVFLDIDLPEIED